MFKFFSKLPGRTGKLHVAESLSQRAKQADKKPTELIVSRDSSYYLKLRANSAGLIFARVWIYDDPLSRPLFMPVGEPSAYQIKSHGKDVRLLFDPSEVTVETFRRWHFSDFPRLLVRFGLRRFGRINNPSLDIVPLVNLAGRDRLEIPRAMRTLFQWGFGVSTSNFQDTLWYQFAEHKKRGEISLESEKLPTAIVIHLHYPELWPDFENRLALISRPFGLILTLTNDNAMLVEQIKKAWPNTKVVVYPNRGRDVGPFVQLWRDGHLDGYDLICKLHGKKSTSSGPRAVFGDVWRKASLNALIGSDALVSGIIDKFAQNKRLGVIGPEPFRLPNKFRNSYRDTWSNNEENTLDLARRIGSTEPFHLDFFAGTMFWMRRELLDLLKPLNLSQDSFPNEEGQLDGTLQHAMERLFGALPDFAKDKMTKENSIWSDDGAFL